MQIKKVMRCRNTPIGGCGREYVAEVLETSADTAPIALIVRADGKKTVYRWFNDQLYTPFIPQAPWRKKFTSNKHLDPLTAEELARGLDVYASHNHDEKEIEKLYAAEAANYLIIEGFTWQKADEPYLRVTCPANGTVKLQIMAHHNHARPGLVTRKDEFTFSALQENDARSFAAELASKRGETDVAAALISAERWIAVYLPSAIRFQRDSFLYMVSVTTRREFYVRACSETEAEKLMQETAVPCVSESTRTNYVVCDKENRQEEQI